MKSSTKEHCVYMKVPSSLQNEVKALIALTPKGRREVMQGRHDQNTTLAKQLEIAEDVKNGMSYSEAGRARGRRLFCAQVAKFCKRFGVKTAHKPGGRRKLQ